MSPDDLLQQERDQQRLALQSAQIGGVKRAYQPAYPNAPSNSVSNTNDQADAMIGLGQTAATTAAPTINDPTAGADRANALAGLSGLNTMASGGGPAAAAAQAQYANAQNATALNALSAIGAHRGGGAGAAAAANAGIGAGAAGGIQNAVAAGNTRAAMTGQAAGAYNQGVAGLTGADWDTGAGAANLQANQNAINQQGQLKYLGIANQLQQNQLSADTSEYQANVGSTAAAQGLAASQQAGLIGGAVGAGAGLASAGVNATETSGSGGGSVGPGQDGKGGTWSDVKMREPGGGSGWTIREEPDFLLARNDRTGELRKLATQPLTPDEHQQAIAPHGAGPIGATRPGARVVGDLNVGTGSNGGRVNRATTPLPGASGIPSSASATPPGASAYGPYGAPTGSNQSPSAYGQSGFAGSDSGDNTTNANGDRISNDSGFASNQLANYGGSEHGAEAFTDYTNSLAANAGNGAAPQIGGANIDQDQSMQNAGLAALGMTAAGKGPAIDAARNQIAHNTAQGQQTNSAIANSATGGGRGIAAAQGTASLQNAQAQGGLTAQQAAVAAQMQAQAQQQYASAATGILGARSQGALQNAGLSQQQQALGQNGALGFYGLGASATGAQLSSEASQYGATQAANSAAAAAKQQQDNALALGIMGAGQSVGGAMMKA